MYTLKKGEQEIMELFWEKNSALTHSDVFDLLQHRISKNTIYLHLNRLLDKGFLQIGTSIRRGRTYGRTFTVAISKTEYYAKQIDSATKEDQATLEDVFTYFLDSENITNEILDELEKRIQKKRTELNA